MNGDDAWPVNEAQVVQQTGKPLAHWAQVLDAFGAVSKKPRNIVGHLHAKHGVPRFWAHTLMMWYMKRSGPVGARALNS